MESTTLTLAGRLVIEPRLAVMLAWPDWTAMRARPSTRAMRWLSDCQATLATSVRSPIDLPAFLPTTPRRTVSPRSKTTGAGTTQISSASMSSATVTSRNFFVWTPANSAATDV